MGNRYKEQLSDHVEAIFKEYSQPGLHICDIATGGGKSYTIGKLTCEYYPKYFDRIVILCVQNKLVVSMDKEIERFIKSDKSLISGTDKLVVENNIEVAQKAIESDSYPALFNEMDCCVNKLKEKNKDLQNTVKLIRKIYGGLKSIAPFYNDEKVRNEYLLEEITKSESNLRHKISQFFNAYRKHLEHKENVKRVSVASINKDFPSLKKVYPQVELSSKNVLLMTVHKAMYGIDPILTERISLTDFSEKRKKTLILLDESDQAATAMRSIIIDQSIDGGNGQKRYANGYNAYLQYKNLVDNHGQVYDDCYGDTLSKCIERAKSITGKNWEKTFKDIPTYNNIFLSDMEELENYRRGVFFSGPILKLNVAQKNAGDHSYVCYKKGAKHFVLEHSKDGDSLESKYQVVVPMSKFLTLVMGNTTAIKSQLRRIVTESLQKSRDTFLGNIKGQQENAAVKNTYMGYPSLETEIHSLFSRFETSGEWIYEQQLNEFITNRKNLKFGEGDEKIPDYTVYSQGVQLYLEEVDEKDNQHRVRLSSREITTTPEKMLVDLVLSNDNSIVLCSATASSRSVVSNFDIAYIKQVLGDKVDTLSKDDRVKFDSLMDKVSPKEHKVEVVPVEHYEFPDNRLNHLTLPDKYKALFCLKAQKDGSADRWFTLTRRKLEKEKELSTDIIKNVSFQFYRYFQYIEAYHWFYTHDDIHSMIYFQNRTGDKDRDQYHILSCLVDGSYENAIGHDLPKNWENENIRISKDWEDVESNILSELAKDKNTKIMLVSAYGSFKAGANMQYTIPEGLDVVSGENWETERIQMKKDWDAVFLQSPTSYLTMNEEVEMNSEKSLYNAMLVLMMLFERGCLSRHEVTFWLNKALSGNFYFSEKTSAGITKDKAAWTQTIVEQAVGRLCRTRNKPSTTYILYDESMVDLFDVNNLDKSLTKEFRLLAESIMEHQQVEKTTSPEETIRSNQANEAKRMLDFMRSRALKLGIHKDEDDDYEEDFSDSSEIPHIVRISQKMNQAYKQTIIRKPVISSLEDLDEVDKQTTFISKCYGNWQHNGNDGYVFYYDSNIKKVVTSADKGKCYSIDIASVRLDILMKNDVIRNHFVRHGYATDWNKEGMILHPEILASDYAGEIGEEAFKALVMYYCDIKEDELKHLEGRDYELADFVLLNSDGIYKMAFDVKNMRQQGHDDCFNDMTTTDKRKRKLERLKCPLYTVNMLQLESQSIDVQHEISGLLTNEGAVDIRALQHLKLLINGIWK